MSSSRIIKLSARIERWPIAGSFTISRGAKTEAVTVVAEVSSSGHVGCGECVPYPRYGETPEATLATLKPMRELLKRGLDRQALQAAMPAGAARNALDCALVDLEAKISGQRAWDLLGRPAPQACTTAYTISLGTPAIVSDIPVNREILSGDVAFFPPGNHDLLAVAMAHALQTPKQRPPAEVLWRQGRERLRSFGASLISVARLAAGH